ncbi:MAG: family protein RssA, partial [Pseudomonadota bacterium]
MRMKWLWILLLWLGLVPGALAQSSAPVPAQAGVVVVLAGGGAKGFAHLAVLRRLERDGVRIERLVGTSMGAVIGGLYASGLSTDEIERVIGNLDPAKVALDQIDRQELPLRAREYQRQYPIEMEFGLKAGQLSFARGVSDGQRFLALLQQLTAHVPPHVRFDELKIPFRAVATRYRDGEMTIFREGSLHLAIRASMAAPGVFAPVEIDGETYVDGGLVANLPVEVAFQEGAQVIVASYLGQAPDNADASSGNALVVANQMLNILIRQNEKRNLALLRAQDVLVQPQLGEVGFTDFRRAADIVALGEQAVQAQDARFAALAQSESGQPPAQGVRQRFDEREMVIDEVRVSGTEHTQADFV